MGDDKFQSADEIASNAASQTGALETDSQARQWAMLAHLSTFAGYLIPFGNIVGPLVVWLMKKDELPFVDEHAKEALNFQISMTIWIAIAVASIFCFVGIAITPILVVLDIVFTIIAAIKANSGERYRYPMTIRFV
jgi:uncharacterized Tic20 family protein